MKDLRNHTAKLVIVEADTCSVRGTVHKATGTTLELVKAEMLTDGGTSKPIDGIFILPSNRIAWVQVV